MNKIVKKVLVDPQPDKSYKKFIKGHNYNTKNALVEGQKIMVVDDITIRCTLYQSKSSGTYFTHTLKIDKQNEVVESIFAVPNNLLCEEDKELIKIVFNSAL